MAVAYNFSYRHKDSSVAAITGCKYSGIVVAHIMADNFSAIMGTEA